MKALGLVGCCALVPLIVLVSFRSANCAEPSPRPADSSETMCRCAGPASPAAVRIAQILAEPLKASGLDFTEEPLENVVNFLQSEYDIPIQLDGPALDDAGLTQDEAVTVNVRNVSLRSALRLLLKTNQLTYVIRDEVLIITTPEEAESELVVCVYDVRDLIGKRNACQATEIDRRRDRILRGDGDVGSQRQGRCPDQIAAIRLARGFPNPSRA